MALLTTKNLSKTYKDVKAIDNISLELESGKVYGLIGRNGAGKTTLLKTISHLIHPTSGEMAWDHRTVKASTDIAFARDSNLYIAGYKLKEILAYAALIYPNYNKTIEKELVDGFQLDLKKTYQKASKGMQTMFSIVVAMASNAAVLLLDEPYVGLDPINREFFYKKLRKYYFNEEKTVILSSHLIQEVEGYFEEIIMIHNGQVILEEPLEAVYEKAYVISGPKEKVQRVESQFNIIGREELSGHLNLYVYNEMSQELIGKCHELDLTVNGMDLQKLMIEMVTGSEG